MESGETIRWTDKESWNWIMVKYIKVVSLMINIMEKGKWSIVKPKNMLEIGKMVKDMDKVKCMKTISWNVGLFG